MRRLLPTRGRRTVGAWCFVEQYGPLAAPLAPHPHQGVQVIEWLLSGRLHHRDSLGTDLLLEPGGLLVLTAGRGVVHAARPALGRPPAGLRMWVALPAGRREQPPHVEHHQDLPTVCQDGATVRVLAGAYRGVAAPTAVHTPLVGLDVELDRTTVLELATGYEHAVLLLAGRAEVDGEPLRNDELLYAAPGRAAFALAGDPGARLVVLGGAPFDEELLLWWTFAGRSDAEIAAAGARWAAQGVRAAADLGAGAPLPAPQPPGRLVPGRLVPGHRGAPRRR